MAPSGEAEFGLGEGEGALVQQDQDPSQTDHCLRAGVLGPRAGSVSRWEPQLDLHLQGGKGLWWGVGGPSRPLASLNLGQRREA